MIWNWKIFGNWKKKLNNEHTLKTIHFKIGRSINVSIGQNCFIPFQNALKIVAGRYFIVSTSTAGL